MQIKKLNAKLTEKSKLALKKLFFKNFYST